MSAARLNVVVFLACGVLAVVAVWRFAREPPQVQRPASSPLSAVPQGAMLVATLDARKLRGTRLGAVLLAGGGELPGLGPITDACGFDPTLKLDRLVFAVPNARPGMDPEAPIEFGIAGFGDFSSQNVAACASTLIGRRGGSPLTSRVGSFTSVRQRQGSDGEIAVRDGGPALLGGGRYLREMIDAADGRLPDASQDERHRTLRKSVGEDATLLASWVLSSGWLEELVGNRLLRLSPLASVDGVALRVDVGPRILVTLAAGCGKPELCSDLAEVTEALVEGELNPLLDAELQNAKGRLRVTTVAGQVQLALWLEEAEAVQLLSRVFENLGTPPASTPSATGPPLIPDEVLRPPASGR